MKLIKYILIFVGTLSLCVGILGILIPGLPTTPFLLLTAALYIRSSDRLYHALINNKYLGSYILRFRSEKGIKKGFMLSSVLIMWLMIIASCYFFLTSGAIKILVIILGVAGTIVMLLIIPTSDN
jgi:uncharacterized membrane protein YbaN (DUF454 family)